MIITTMIFTTIIIIITTTILITTIIIIITIITITTTAALLPRGLDQAPGLVVAALELPQQRLRQARAGLHYYHYCDYYCDYCYVFTTINIINTITSTLTITVIIMIIIIIIIITTTSTTTTILITTASLCPATRHVYLCKLAARTEHAFTPPLPAWPDGASGLGSQDLPRGYRGDLARPVVGRLLEGSDAADFRTERSHAGIVGGSDSAKSTL